MVGLPPRADPGTPDGIRWLDIEPGARGRYVRVELATPDWSGGIATQPVAQAAAAARLLDRAGDGLAGRGPGQPGRPACRWPPGSRCSSPT